MKKVVFRAVMPAVVLAFAASANAQIAPVLLEACNALQPSSKRLECLRAAGAVRSNAGSGAPSRTSASSTQTATQQFASTSAPKASSSGVVCYTGPRGGTYTITASGRKNYSGC